MEMTHLNLEPGAVDPLGVVGQLPRVAPVLDAQLDFSGHI